MSHSTDVLVIGGSGVDTIVPVPELPLPWADSYPLDRPIVTRAGQTGDFLAHGLAALGLRTHHLDQLGDDHEGDLVRALHRDQGITLTQFPAPLGTRRAVNLVDPRGRRLSLYDGRRAAGDELVPMPAIEELARTSRHVHVCITAPYGPVVAHLAGLGVSTSTDLHNWDSRNEYHEQFAYQADIVFVSTTALKDPVGSMHRIIDRGRARLVIATSSAQGARILSPEGLLEVPALPPPAPVIDSNGAGDAFAAAFLFGELTGEPLERCARYGAVAGGYACTVRSDQVDSISRAELLERTRQIEEAAGYSK